MHSRTVTSLVMLTALAFASSPAIAATAKAEVSSSSSSKPTTRHSPRKKATTKKKGFGAMLASHERRKGAEQSIRPHMAEPAKTPAVAASLSEPMVTHTVSTVKPGAHGTSKVEPKIIPAIERGKRIKMKPVVAHDKAKIEAEEPAPPIEAAADTQPDAHGGRHLLTRPAAVAAAASEVAAVVPAPPQERGKHGKALIQKACLHDGVEFMRGQDVEKFALSQCDGSPAPFAIERLSVLVRPESVQKPAAAFDALAKEKGPEIAPGIRKIDAGLVSRLQEVVSHFGKIEEPARISVISGYRPNSTGSYHATGQALDMRIDGVKNEDLVAFCKTLPDTGCGYYPNSSFVHMDVRAPSTGHVYWIDTSGPGETPHYVSSWPPPPEPPALNDAREASAKVIEGLDRALPPLPVDSHPAVAETPAASMTTPIADEKQASDLPWSKGVKP